MVPKLVAGRPFNELVTSSRMNPANGQVPNFQLELKSRSVLLAA